MKKEEEDIIHYGDPAAIQYWSRKWEISPTTIFNAYVQIKSNRIDTLKDHLRKIGFAL